MANHSVHILYHNKIVKKNIFVLLSKNNLVWEEENKNAGGKKRNLLGLILPTTGLRLGKSEIILSEYEVVLTRIN
jgi:hypothetical protein